MRYLGERKVPVHLYSTVEISVKEHTVLSRECGFGERCVYVVDFRYTYGTSLPPADYIMLLEQLYKDNSLTLYSFTISKRRKTGGMYWFDQHKI
jgi:hypothetical protein